ncbi:MAG TPA: aldo/keto reductase [Thermoanaerobaculia bacterium]|nr:aldo/keto reductase [Thermoanaerobaculia bacterium]
MKYAKLGRTGLDCSRLGFGTWQIGGERWKGLQHNEAIALLQHALDCGINIFDAASVYGLYRGEVNEQRSRALELLGEAFSGKRREQVLICLKVGQVDEYSHRAMYHPRNMVQELHRALRSLRTEYVDIFLVHAPSLSEVRDGRALAVVQTIQAMGLAKFVGYSFDAEPEHVKLALNQEIDVMMLQYNLLDEECAEAFGLAHENGIGMLICGPYKRGYLSGRFDKTDDLPLEDNYWAWNLRYNRAKVESILDQAFKLKQEAGGARQLRGRALHHILRHPGATAAVVGHRSSEEVTDNIQLVDEIFSYS